MVSELYFGHSHFKIKITEENQEKYDGPIVISTEILILLCDRQQTSMFSTSTYCTGMPQIFILMHCWASCVLHCHAPYVPPE